MFQERKHARLHVAQGDHAIIKSGLLRKPYSRIKGNSLKTFNKHRAQQCEENVRTFHILRTRRRGRNWSCRTAQHVRHCCGACTAPRRAEAPIVVCFTRMQTKGVWVISHRSPVRTFDACTGAAGSKPTRRRISDRTQTPWVNVLR
jgi:hypothetical protein